MYLYIYYLDWLCVLNQICINTLNSIKTYRNKIYTLK